MTRPNGTQAIDRAAQLLTQVVQCPGPVTFGELTAASGLAKSTASRLLMALERHQLVRRDASGRFRPGELFIRYAWRGTAGTDLVAVAQPFLDRLGEQTGETVNLGVAGSAGAGDGQNRRSARGTGHNGSGHSSASHSSAGQGRVAGQGGAGLAAGTVVEQIAQVDSRFMIGGTNWVGLKVPLHCSALGKVLLAFGAADLPPGRLRPRTARTITTRAALNAELAVIRSRGFAVTDAELEPGLVAVAAPVFAGGPVAVAAISVSGPAARLTPRQIPAVARWCRAAAGELSDVLGTPLTIASSQTEGAA
ncbi:MAG TPA: IclR family transcriptional regulator [Streptosporangiaceae bacterium]|nr:IclR family transcriptional regulator [Streptosporangiaceae bacterium]